jgi:hypothetical protein
MVADSGSVPRGWRKGVNVLQNINALMLRCRNVARDDAVDDFPVVGVQVKYGRDNGIAGYRAGTGLGSGGASLAATWPYSREH